MKRVISITLLTFTCAVFASANIARPEPVKTPVPKPTKSFVTNMDIRLDSNATEAKLIIPRSQIKQLRAQLDEIEDADDNTAAVTTPGVSRTQAIISGAFLSLALVFGGIWFVRSGKAATKGGKALALAIVCGVIGSAATLVYANAGPPSEARSISGKMFSPAVHIYGFGWGKVRVEAGSENDRIQLIVPNPKTESAPSN